MIIMLRNIIHHTSPFNRQPIRIENSKIKHILCTDAILKCVIFKTKKYVSSSDTMDTALRIQCK